MTILCVPGSMTPAFSGCPCVASGAFLEKE
jgi:hypothetical protein